MNTYTTMTELKDAIKAINPDFFKSGKNLGVYKTIKTGNSGKFIELAKMWGGEFRASLKEFDGVRVNKIKSFDSSTIIDSKQAKALLA